jgi:hypothetical protein
MDIQSALARLNSQLPLKARQDSLPGILKSAHQRVITSLVTYGRPPDEPELTALLGEGRVAAGLHQLAAADLVVLDAQGERVVGAYPVTVETTPHQLSVNGHRIYAMCALDAVSVAPMFATEVEIASVCHRSQVPIAIRMRGCNVLAVHPGQDPVIGIRWQAPVGNAAHSMCTQMIFLKDWQTALAWQQADTQSISLFSLTQAVALGAAFFQPLLAG